MNSARMIRTSLYSYPGAWHAAGNSMHVDTHKQKMDMHATADASKFAIPNLAGSSCIAFLQQHMYVFRCAINSTTTRTWRHVQQHMLAELQSYP